MTTQAPEGWERLGNSFVKPSIRGPLWRILPTHSCWRLCRDADQAIEFGAYRGLTLAISDTPDGVAARADQMDAHSLKLDDWIDRSISAERPGPSGLNLVAHKAAGDHALTVRLHVPGVGSGPGSRVIHFESARTCYVLGEDVVSGSTFIDEALIGKGIGLALYQFGDELAGYRSTPHGRNGAGGMLTPHSEGFWRKRAQVQSVPGDADVEGVAARLAEVDAVIPIQWAERSAFLDVDVAVALARAVGGVPSIVVAPDGYAKGWATAPDGRTLTTRGWDSVPEIETRRGKVRTGFKAAEGHSGLMASLSISKASSPLVVKAASIALNLHHSSGWTPENLMSGERMPTPERMRAASP